MFILRNIVIAEGNERQHGYMRTNIYVLMSSLPSPHKLCFLYILAASRYFRYIAICSYIGLPMLYLVTFSK